MQLRIEIISEVVSELKLKSTYTHLLASFPGQHGLTGTRQVKPF